MGIGAGQEGGEKRGREERAARLRRGGREPRSAAPAPASCASRAAARRGPSRDGLARGLPLLLLPRPAAPPPRRAPPAGEWPRRAGGRRPVRHGWGGQCRGRSPGGAGPRGRGDRGWRPGLGVRDREGHGEPRQLAARKVTRGRGAGRGARSNSGRGRHAFARPGAHTPRDPARPCPARTRAPRTGAAPGSPWGTLPHTQARDRPGLGGLSFSTSHRGN